jgi:Flp pilus assembly protein TadD
MNSQTSLALSGKLMQSFKFHLHKTMSQQDISHHLNEFDGHLRCGRHDQAVALCRQIMQMLPDTMDADILISQLWQRLGDFDAMLAAAGQAAQRESDQGIACGEALLRLIESEIYCSQIASALQRLSSAEAGSAGDASQLQKIAHLYLHCSNHEAAGRCYEKIAVLEPNRPQHMFNHAASLVILGEMGRAEKLLDQVLELAPAHVERCKIGPC